MANRHPPHWARPLVLAAGLWVWALTVVGSSHQEDAHLGLFFLVTGAAGLGLGYLVDEHPAVLGGLLAAGPFIGSWWTTPRGDNDGLWVLGPMIVGASWMAFAWCAAVGEIIRKATTSERAIPSALHHHPRMTGVAGLAALAAATLAIAQLRPDPWPELRDRLAEFPRPTAFNAPVLDQSGDPLCDHGCLATVTATMSTRLDLTSACSRLESALTDWPGASDLRAVPALEMSEPPYSDRCAFELHVNDGGAIWAEVVSGDGQTLVTLRAPDASLR